jgi:hemerythrin-like metal-binding protein/PAS domain S-box-containing protein
MERDMGIFVWNNSYSVGIGEVDSQHQVLVRLINDLDAAVTHGTEEAVLLRLLGELVAYAQYHFTTEEQMMLAAGVETGHCRRHKLEHDNFAHSVGSRLEQIDPGNSAATHELLDFLVKWLIGHIMLVDKEMARLARPEAPAGIAPVPDPALRIRQDAEFAQQALIAALRESESRFRILTDTVPLLIWMTEQTPGRVFFNQTWLDFSGRQLAGERGDGWMQGLHPEDAPKFAEQYLAAFAGRQRYTAEFRLRRADGEYRWFLETGVPRNTRDGGFAGFTGSGVDITRRKQAEAVLRHARDQLEIRVAERTAELSGANRQLLEEKAEQQTLIKKLEEAHNQLLQSEKMASIGQLAAGVAHEINNPIGYVNSNLGTLGKYVQDLLRMLAAYDGEKQANASPAIQALRRELDIDFLREDTGNLLKESLEGVERVKRIVQDLKDFSHVDEAEWQYANLNRGLESTLNVAWNEIKYKAEVVKDYGEIPDIRCLPQQLNQVFMNVLVNAAQAMDRRGSISILTRFDGERVCVTISDTGKGIPPELLTRIFDPFFTTKPIGKGTGLGLSIAYGIINKHKGKIEVESTVGQGTTFRIYLPATDQGTAAAESERKS